MYIARNIKQIATEGFLLFFGSFGSKKHHIKNRTKSDHQKGIFLTCWQKMKKKVFCYFSSKTQKWIESWNIYFLIDFGSQNMILMLSDWFEVKLTLRNKLTIIVQFLVWLKTMFAVFKNKPLEIHISSGDGNIYFIQCNIYKKN